ncbi:unnamed protein product [Urochloa decumbens]|uniref:WRKY domain-containing protein n=1 Tax=Urochloa decumbens TaxID=240449 RepID=A0ABC8WI29_9POAL
MSGAGAGGYGGLYGDPAADHFAAFDHNDFFFQRSLYAGEGGGSGAGDGLMTAPYSSITDYLQGFLDPAGLAAHLDAPCRFGDDAAVKQEMEAAVQLIRHEGPAAGAPVTPNSSVLSSSSCEAGADEETQRRDKQEGSRLEEEEDEQEEIDADEGSAADRNCKSKAKKQKAITRGEKKPREPRVAFMTKSEVDHLEDGYRWRKYGQKAVKNSSYPRSYYRCTAARCGVKKRVERSHHDPSTVVTTYEGQHTHPSPLSLLRPGAAGVYHGYAAAPPRLGIRSTDPRAVIDYARGTRMATAGSLLLPQAGGGLATTATGLLQEHRGSSSPHLAAYGGVLDFIPSAMGGDEHA